jgi:hypothetical protein
MARADGGKSWSGYFSESPLGSGSPGRSDGENGCRGQKQPEDDRLARVDP